MKPAAGGRNQKRRTSQLPAPDPVARANRSESTAATPRPPQRLAPRGGPAPPGRAFDRATPNYRRPQRCTTPETQPSANANAPTACRLPANMRASAASIDRNHNAPDNSTIPAPATNPNPGSVIGKRSFVLNGGATTSVAPTDAKPVHNCLKEIVWNQDHSSSPRLRRPTQELILRGWRLNSRSVTFHTDGSSKRNVKRPPKLTITSSLLSSNTARVRD